MRVIFCGNPDFAVPTLEALLTSPHEVAAVVCSPDKPRGRGRKVVPLPVKERALAAGLSVLQPANLGDPLFLEQIRVLSPDALVVAAFRILPRELFAMPRHGSINVHPSLLPRGRGPAPIRWTLLRGEQETGVTIIRLTEQIDAGGMLAQERVTILPDEDYGSLSSRLARIGAEMLVGVLDRLGGGESVAPLPQDESLATKAPKLHPPDFRLDWTCPLDKILNQIRALSPEPGAWTSSGESKLKILRAEPANSLPELQPGIVLVKNDALFAGTGTGPARLREVKPEGKRAMTTEEFLRGRPNLPPRFES